MKGPRRQKHQDKSWPKRSELDDIMDITFVHISKVLISVGTEIVSKAKLAVIQGRGHHG